MWRMLQFAHVGVPKMANLRIASVRQYPYCANDFAPVKIIRLVTDTHALKQL